MMGMPRELTAASIPLRTLALYLGLTDAQTGKIALIREDMQDALRPQMPQRRPQQDPNVQAAERKATNDTTALLNEAQRTRLNTLVKALKGLQQAGVRPDAAVKLQLSDEQLVKLAAGRGIESVLSAEQQQVAQEYKQPQGGPGGPGGFPGGPGGFGGPPPGFGG